jgi:hypothetical protein
MISELAQEYKSFYKAVSPENVSTFLHQTNAIYFEVSDKLDVIEKEGDGIAKYHNETETLINIVNFEQFINQFKQNTTAGRGMKCDLILFDFENKILVFNELTNTQVKYLYPHLRDGGTVEGKQQHAFSQLKYSVERLENVPVIRDRINLFLRRVLIFSHRNPTPQDNDIVGVNLLKMTRTVSKNVLFRLDESPVIGFETYVQPYPIPFEL